MSALRSAEGVAARCLEFAVLTAARTSEALLAEWTEFDLDAGTWTVPARRMKAKEEHVVYGYTNIQAFEALQQSGWTLCR